MIINVYCTGKMPMDKIKKLIVLSIAAIMLLSLFAPMLLIQPVSAADPADWYMTINGVLNTDYYKLYPYESALLKVGLSKFGELIDDTTNVGLEYDNARDPFASPAGPYIDEDWLPKNVWINGWYMSILYNHSVWGLRHVWAGALFADLDSYGGPWLRVDDSYLGPGFTEADEDFRKPGKPIDEYGNPIAAAPLQAGGRKTNGTAVTEPIAVLYYGPRLFVAELTTHIYDYHDITGTKIHLLDFVITVIFNRVKKEVILIKDVKFIPHYKYMLKPLTIKVKCYGDSYQPVTIDKGILVQLSNREEWDLGPDGDYRSYVHFYVAENSEGQSTVYDSKWTMLPTLPPNTKVKLPGGVEVTVNKYGSEPKLTAGTYDVAQIISSDMKYVGWHAFWPSLSDWEADAGRRDLWWRAIYDDDPHNTDSGATPNDEPFMSPLIVGEWDFLLSDTNRTTTVCSTVVVPVNVQFRGVSVYGVTDRNDGDDQHRTGGTNKIDSEVKYQLAEIFNPWDLAKAVDKDTSRFVILETRTVTTQTKIDYCVGFNAIISKEADVARTGNPSGVLWNSYCNFTERVLVDGNLLSPGIKQTPPYYVAREGVDNKWYINVTIPAGTHTIKILWSNQSMIDSKTVGRYEWIIVGRDAATVDSAGAALVASAFKDKVIKEYSQSDPGGALIGLAGADMLDPVIANQMPWVMHRFGTGHTKTDYKDTIGRAALRDDWCKTWPIASSNMIGVGGPLANMLAYYANDFTQAFFGLEEFAASIWDNKIIPLTCWDITKTRVYASNETVGYAVIATYKDLNGTVLFMIWGHWGRDTYYVCKWFHEVGIYQLQGAPAGLTSIIVKITYESTPEGYKPKAFSIVECLGTISETLWKHGTELKGGIHDP